MTRQAQPPNPVGVAFWVGGTIVALWLILLWNHHELIWWFIGIHAGAAILGLGIVAAAARAEAKGLREEMERRDRETPSWRRATAKRCISQSSHDVHLWASDGGGHICPGREAHEAADVVRVPLLRVVPTQRKPADDVYNHGGHL